MSQHLASLCSFFAREHDASLELPPNSAHQRQLLHALLTVRPPRPLDASIEAQLDALLRDESKQRGVVSLDQIRDERITGDTQISLWRGDLRNLQVDSIVNAANSGAIGCFAPAHKCIDNVLHGSAGPSVRRECAKRRPIDGLGVGEAMVTGAGALPAQSIIHTVGPQVPDGNMSVAHCEALASCYTASLDAAAALSLRSVAFPCISTGLFGAPELRSAHVAVAAVRGWLASHEHNSVEHVVFVAFTDANERALAAALGVDVRQIEATIVDRSVALARQAARAIAAADVVIVTGGAGMSAAAGVDYTDRELHARFFPDMVDRGFTCMYDYIGRGIQGEDVMWGFYARQVGHVRYGTEMIVNDTYDRLRSLVGDKRYFCVTSNVDGLLHRLGHFDSERVWERQGTYSLMQCKESHCRATWPTRPEIDRLAAALADDGSTSAPPPRCPTCGSDNVFMQVRGGSWFTEEPQEAQRAAYKQFVASLGANDRIVVLELGSGFNTPTVIRVPNERFVARHRNATLVRVSVDHPDVPDTIAAQSICVAQDIHHFLTTTDEELKKIN